MRPLLLIAMLSGCASSEYAFDPQAFSQSMQYVQMPQYEAPAYVPPPSYVPRQIIQPTYQPQTYQPVQPYQPVPAQHYRMPTYQQPTSTIYKTNCGTVGASVECTTVGY